jgi:hypothetical protein
MSDCKPCSTSVYTQAKVSSDMGGPISDPTAYRNKAGTLQYLTFTWPKITYVVQQVCLHMHDPHEPQLRARKCIIRYLQGSLDHDRLLHHGPPSGYTVFLGDNLVSWSSKCKNIVSRSSTEAEYRTMANGVAKACWFRQ